jgi:hypothetical protein
MKIGIPQRHTLPLLLGHRGRLGRSYGRGQSGGDFFGKAIPSTDGTDIIQTKLEGITYGTADTLLLRFAFLPPTPRTVGKRGFGNSRRILDSPFVGDRLHGLGSSGRLRGRKGIQPSQQTGILRLQLSQASTTRRFVGRKTVQAIVGNTEPWIGRTRFAERRNTSWRLLAPMSSGGGLTTLLGRFYYGNN